MKVASFFILFFSISNFALSQNQAFITITVDKPDVAIFIDAVGCGTISPNTPLIKQITASQKHTIAAQKEGYEPFFQDVLLAPGQKIDIAVQFIISKQPSVSTESTQRANEALYGDLTLSVNYNNTLVPADIFVDGSILTNTKAPFTIKDLTVGWHNVKATYLGLEKSESVYIHSHTRETLVINLEPILPPSPPNENKYPSQTSPISKSTSGKEDAFGLLTLGGSGKDDVGLPRIMSYSFQAYVRNSDGHSMAIVGFGYDAISPIDHNSTAKRLIYPYFRGSVGYTFANFGIYGGIIEGINTKKKFFGEDPKVLLFSWNYGIDFVLKIPTLNGGLRIAIDGVHIINNKDWQTEYISNNQYYTFQFGWLFGGQ